MLHTAEEAFVQWDKKILKFSKTLFKLLSVSYLKHNDHSEEEING